ncbi:unnamed protein product, partial [marine sediment metagenome]
MVVFDQLIEEILVRFSKNSNCDAPVATIKVASPFSFIASINILAVSSAAALPI